ncbi:helicase [Tanacetum coccineum]
MAALTSSGVPIVYHNLGPPSHQCSMCNAPMWYNERSKKSRKAVTLSFSLCFQDGKVLLPRFNDTPQPLKKLLDYNDPTASKFKDQIIVYNTEGVPLRYAQLYFFDTQNEIKNRMSAFMSKEAPETVDENIVANLIQMLLSERTTTRQYNAPTVSEVSALIINDFGDGLPIRDIVVNKNNTGPQRISELHPSYMALQYPLLFPFGEDGYHENIPYNTNKGTRKTKRRLFQQYLVDAFTAIEEQRLNWTRNNQDTLRVDLYHNLCDAVTRGDTNAMALCRTYGNPDLFITFTSNPKWPEIAEMLAYISGQKSHDRPEIGTRVFKMKLIGLLEDLTKHHIFGKYCAVVYVIEFQKRGLPHAQILLWLEEEFKCRIPDQINDIISAELPCPTNDPDAYKLVSDFMLHGPCGVEAKHAPCTNEGKCSKHNKITAVKGKFTYDNRHVVPHNRYLLLKYHAHINVEWCNRSKAIKYLFKYLNKGPDRATIAIQENVKVGANGESDQIIVIDEIKNYLNCRFLSPCEAVWRLFSFDINYAYPTIMQLNYHLPDQNTITLRDSEHLTALLEREGISITMFTEWFELNKEYPEAREYTYAEIPQHYVWHTKDKVEKKEKKCIGRIIYATPAYRERYFLRMLLNVVRGAQSFTDLKMVNKINYATFKAACFAYGLLNDDKEWTHAIVEASIWAMAPQLHKLFVTILLFSNVSRPLKLWEENWVRLSEDILNKKRKQYRYPEPNMSDEQVRNYCLLEIQDLLNTHGQFAASMEQGGNRDNRKSLNLPDQNAITLRDSEHLPALLEREGISITMFTEWFELNKEYPEAREYTYTEIPQHHTLQDILGYKNQARRNRIFGGMTVLLGGDFRQILSVIPNAKRPEESEDEPTWIEIPEEFLIKSWTSPIEQIVAETYLDFTSRQGDDEYLTERAILTPRNDDADAINENMFKKLGGAPVTYNSANEICKASTDTVDQDDLYLVEFLNSLNFLGMPPMPSA